MYKDIMNQEVGQAIQSNTQPCKEMPGKTIRAYNNQNDGWNGEHKAKQIIQLKYPFTRLMVWFMPDPQKPVHDVFMCKPSNSLHEGKKSPTKPVAMYVFV